VVLNGPIREALLNVEEFSSLLEAHVVVEARCVENKTHRPQSSVGGLARRRYAEYWASDQPALPRPHASDYPG
jgi:hypothetical protein